MICILYKYLQGILTAPIVMVVHWLFGEISKWHCGVLLLKSVLVIKSLGWVLVSLSSLLSTNHKMEIIPMSESARCIRLSQLVAFHSRVVFAAKEAFVLLAAVAPILTWGLWITDIEVPAVCRVLRHSECPDLEFQLLVLISRFPPRTSSGTLFPVILWGVLQFEIGEFVSEKLGLSPRRVYRVDHRVDVRYVRHGDRQQGVLLLRLEYRLLDVQPKGCWGDGGVDDEWLQLLPLYLEISGPADQQDL